MWHQKKKCGKKGCGQRNGSNKYSGPVALTTEKHMEESIYSLGHREPVKRMNTCTNSNCWTVNKNH